MLTSGAFGYLADYVLWWMLYLSLLVHTWCFFRLFPRDKLFKSALVLGNALVFACMLGLIALAAESYFRFVCVETDAFGMSLPARRWFALHTNLNSLGCRDEEWTVEPHPATSPLVGDERAEVRRIAFVGDSFIYGWGIKRVEDRFPDRIQAMFDQESTGKVEVMNVAKPGWDTGAQLQPIKDMIALYGVDEVVLCYVANDIEKLLPRSDEFDPIRPPEPRLFNPSMSCLADYLYHRVFVPRAPTVSGYHDWLAEGFADPAIWRRHQQQLYAIFHHCQARGITIRVVLLPFIRISGEKFQSARLHGILKRFFESNGAAVLDLLPAIEPWLEAGTESSLIVNSFDPHPNELAHRLFAEAIWQAFYATPIP